MDNTIMMDVDPLSAYETQYNFQPLPDPHYYLPAPQDSQHVPRDNPHVPRDNPHVPQDNPHIPRSETQNPETLLSQPTTSFTYQNEQLQNYPQSYQPALLDLPTENYLADTTQDTEENTEQPCPDPVEEEDIKPDISTLIPATTTKKTPASKKPKGKTSSYWNKKITDKDFAFYGCSICNVSYQIITELDQHMIKHSNRLTTYDVRMINMKKRKLLMKEKKKKKKQAKIKKETDEVEIKPEDGYIGTEKATDVSNSDSKVKNSSAVKKIDKKVKNSNENGPVNVKTENEKKYVHAYKCFACDKLFALSYYLRLHVRSHTDEKPYTCKDCGQQFITASKMGRHRKRIHLATRHQCRICFRIFTRFELLVKHFDSRHAADKLDGEPYDYNAILPYIKELEEQLKVENEKKPKTEDPWGLPPIEDSTAPNIADEVPKEEFFVTKREIEITLAPEMEYFDENKDPAQLPTENVIDGLKIDVAVKQEFDDEQGDDDDHHFQDDDLNFQENDPHLQDDDHHLRDDKDDGVKDEDLDSDEEYKPSKTWVRPHSPLGKAKKSNKSTNCPVCDKFISRKNNLSVHMRTHTGEKPFPCKQCGRGYSSANTLKRHMSDVHKNTKEDNDVVEPKKDPDTNIPKDDAEDLPEIQESTKDDPTSDEDYFPSETWARSPSPLPPPAPQTRRRKYKQGGGTTCEICNKELCSKTYLAIHMRTHTGEKPFSCYICKRSFITASKMHRHVLTHDESWEGKEAIKPEYDTKDVKSEPEMDKNEEVDKEFINKAKSRLLLKKSKKSFFEKKFKKHSKWTHTCEFCNKKFLHLETLQVHKKTHDKNESMKCYFCLEEFTDKDSLNEHQNTHTGPKLYQCNLCKKFFTKRGTMMHHRKKCENVEPSAAGGEGKRFQCDICHKSYNAHSKLQRHLAAHAVSQCHVRYECPVCAHMFHTRYHVQMHLRSHMREGLILEENRNAVLAMVLQNAHKIPKTTEVNSTALPDAPAADERSRICNICGQIFQHFYYLEEHLKTHGSKIALEDLDEEEEKKHTCQVCNKSFKLPYYLKLHSYTHTKEKPFICQQCGKGFITKGKLKRHLETHQGLKKYQCHICYKFFTRPSYLRIHVRTIHGTQDFRFRDYGIGVPIGALSQD